MLDADASDWYEVWGAAHSGNNNNAYVRDLIWPCPCGWYAALVTVKSVGRSCLQPPNDVRHDVGTRPHDTKPSNPSPRILDRAPNLFGQHRSAKQYDHHYRLKYRWVRPRQLLERLYRTEHLQHWGRLYVSYCFSPSL